MIMRISALIPRCNNRGSVFVAVLLMLAVLLTVFGSVLQYTHGNTLMARRAATLAECRAAADGELERMFHEWKLAMMRAEPSADIIRTLSASPDASHGNFNPAFARFTFPDNSHQVTLLAENVRGSYFDRRGMIRNGTLTRYEARVTVETELNGQTVGATVGREFIYFWSSLADKSIYSRGDLEWSAGGTSILHGSIAAVDDIYLGTSGQLIVNSPSVEFGRRFNGDVTGREDLQMRHPRTPGLGSLTPLAPPVFGVGREEQVSRLEAQINTLGGLDAAVLVDSYDMFRNENQVHRAILDPAPANDAAEVAPLRLHNQAGLVIESSQRRVPGSNPPQFTNHVEVFVGTGNNRRRLPDDDPIIAEIVPSVRKPIYDWREGESVPVTTIDVGKVAEVVAQPDSPLQGYNGVVYFRDNVEWWSKSGVRLDNAHYLPRTNQADTFTFGTNKGLYIQGDFNTGGTGTAVPTNAPLVEGQVPSTTTQVPGYEVIPSAVLADAVTLLSSAWDDSKSTYAVQERAATSTTVNTVIASGNRPTGGAGHSGGMQNLVRFLEDWTTPGAAFTMNGSLLRLFQSTHFTGPFINEGAVYRLPRRVVMHDARNAAAKLSGLVVTTFERGQYFNYDKSGN